MTNETKATLTQAGFKPFPSNDMRYGRRSPTTPGEWITPNIDEVMVSRGRWKGESTSITLHVTEDQIPRILAALATPAPALTPQSAFTEAQVREAVSEALFDEHMSVLKADTIGRNAIARLRHQCKEDIND